MSGKHKNLPYIQDPQHAHWLAAKRINLSRAQPTHLSRMPNVLHIQTAPCRGPLLSLGDLAELHWGSPLPLSPKHIRSACELLRLSSPPPSLPPLAAPAALSAAVCLAGVRTRPSGGGGGGRLGLRAAMVELLGARDGEGPLLPHPACGEAPPPSLARLQLMVRLQMGRWSGVVGLALALAWHACLHAPCLPLHSSHLCGAGLERCPASGPPASSGVPDQGLLPALLTAPATCEKARRWGSGDQALMGVPSCGPASLQGREASALAAFGSSDAAAS